MDYSSAAYSRADSISLYPTLMARITAAIAAAGVAILLLVLLGIIVLIVVLRQRGEGITQVP